MKVLEGINLYIEAIKEMLTNIAEDNQRLDISLGYRPNYRLGRRLVKMLVSILKNLN